ncbi:malto-oligosyltrehalose synthase domain protein [Mycobacterium xenopi 3993]|nr:malto-oligosyltrehalose synthase domain protein [Mycobacterium xenopi 3993]
MPALQRSLKATVATDTLASELGRLRRSIVATTGADHAQLPEPWRRCSATSTSTAATTRAWPRRCPELWPKLPRRHRNWARRCRSSRRRWPPAVNPRHGCSSCAAQSPPRRSRTACSTGTPGWCR